ISILSVIITVTACQNPNGAKTNNTEKQSESHATAGDSLLTLVQKQTFQYFWDGAEPNSGLARERIHIDGEYPQNDEDVVTIGGSGFGLMAILVGIHNNFITPEQGEERITRALNFLGSIERFQGVWSH